LYQRTPLQWSLAARTTGFGGALEGARRTAPASALALAATASARPAWLQGWWQVHDGNTDQDCSDAQCQVRDTKTAPTRGTQVVRQAFSDGRVTLSGPASNTVVINRNLADGRAKRETFTRQPERNEMNGTSNRYAPLSARKRLRLRRRGGARFADCRAQATSRRTPPRRNRSVAHPEPICDSPAPQPFSTPHRAVFPATDPFPEASFHCASGSHSVGSTAARRATITRCS